MDEPCSALDPVATAKVEELIHTLAANYTIVVVTHSMAQARRLADHTVFLLNGEVVEADVTTELFGSPSEQRTSDYINGRFG